MTRIEVTIEDSMNRCKECGYALGFHIGLERATEGVKLILYCPHCGTQYDPGILLQLAHPEGGSA